jgi:hypothetical protein
MSTTEISTKETTNESTQTPMSFEDCLTLFGEQMKESYTINEQGETVTLPEDQMADIVNIIEASQERVSEIFKPLFDDISNQIEANKVRINQLTLLVQQKKAASAGTGQSTSEDGDGEGEDEGLPTVDWLIANRKSKSGKAVTGYNCFTMWYMSQNKSGFPPKGLWDQQNKAAWNALAAQVSKGETTGTASSSSGTSAGAALELPEIKGKGTKMTAYNMYTIEYMHKNPGGGFPPKGSWANVSKEEVARYQAMADAVKAQRA